MPRRMYSHLRSIGRSIGRSRPSAPDSSHPFWPIISREPLSRALYLVRAPPASHSTARSSTPTWENLAA